MSIKKTFIFVILLAAVAAYIFLYELPAGKKNQQKKQDDQKPMQIDFDAVERITINRPKIDLPVPGASVNQETVTLVKKGDKWRLDAPVQDIADSYQVTSILNAIRFATVSTRLEQTEKPLSTYGLENPKALVVLKTAKDEQILQIGNKYPIDGSLFVKIADGTQIMIVGDALWEAINKSVDEIRESKLFRRDHGQVVRLKIESGDSVLMLERIPQMVDGKASSVRWNIVYPFSDLADEDATDKLVQDLQNLTINRFIAENRNNDKAFGLDEPFATLTIGYFIEPEETAKNSEGAETAKAGIDEGAIEYEVLKIGSKANGNENYFAALDAMPFVVTLHLGDVDRLLWSGKDLRDRHVVRSETEKAAKIGLQISGSLSNISHSGPDWTFADGKKADPEACENILSGLAQMQGELVAEGEHAKPKDFGITTESDWIELSDLDGNSLLRLVKGAKNEKTDSVFVADLSGGLVRIYNLAVEELGFWPESAGTLEVSETAQADDSTDQPPSPSDE